MSELLTEKELKLFHQKKRTAKLTVNNPDRIFLEELIDFGKVTGKDDACAVYNSHSRFKKYQLKLFRTCYHNLLKSRGIERPKSGMLSRHEY